MKLGIITFHYVINYGSALQAYAMLEAIAKQGADTELIDYRPDFRKISFFRRVLNNRNKLLDFDKWRSFILRKTMYYVDETKTKQRKQQFDKFQNKFYRLSSRITNREELKSLNSTYDAFVCGSDQIWNPTYIGHDMSYFLDYAPINKRIAYAPSIAVNEFPKEYVDEIKNEMKKFINISVRENESVEIVRNLTGKDAKVVVDPTLLLDQNDWEKIENQPIGFKSDIKYIFCYFLGANEEYKDFVNKLKELTNYPIILVTCTELKVFKDYGDINYGAIGPSEFVYLIHHAEFVCTDSFHGTVFSILNKRNFFTFKRYKDNSKTSENSRIYTLLSMIGHQERLIASTNEIGLLYKDSLDYEDIQKRLDVSKAESELYLKNELHRIKGGFLI